jgi:hypothetical protein
MTKIPTAYYISITNYLITLYRVWCSYHNYVGKAIRVKILWHHIGPFGSSLSHFSCFLKGAKPSLNVLMCCLRLFRMLDFDCSYTSLLFSTRWSPYYSWCYGTCREQYLSFPGSITRYLCDVTWGHLITCLAFQKSSGVILSSNVVFFNGPTTWIGIYFTSSKCSFECCANTSLLMCKSNMGAWLFACLNTPLVRLSHFLTTFCIHFNIPHPTVTQFSRC